MGGVLSAADYVVALVDVLADHAVASYFEGEYVVADSETGAQRQRLDVLDRFNRQSGRYRPGQWDRSGLGEVDPAALIGEAAKQSLRF